MYVKECDYAVYFMWNIAEQARVCIASKMLKMERQTERNIAEQPRVCTASKMLKTERQTERESDGVSEGMPCKCKQLAAMSPSVP